MVREVEKLIQNPHPGTEHHQKLISSFDW